MTTRKNVSQDTPSTTKSRRRHQPSPESTLRTNDVTAVSVSPVRCLRSIVARLLFLSSKWNPYGIRLAYVWASSEPRQAQDHLAKIAREARQSIAASLDTILPIKEGQTVGKSFCRARTDFDWCVFHVVSTSDTGL